MLRFVDSLLDRITMYRLVLYFLIVLLAAAAIFGAFGLIPYSPVAIILSTIVLVVVAWAANGIFAAAFGAVPNAESSYITALILALIIAPVAPSAPNAAAGIAFLILAAVLAMASKYILAIRKKHVFNPAAFAVVLTAFTIGRAANWWAGGNIPMMPLVIIGGLLIVRKIRRFDLALTFLAVALLTISFTGASAPLDTLWKAILHTPLFFFAFIMLTEPLTTPGTRWWRVIYGAFVGILFAPGVHIGSIYSTPELALIIGNAFSWIVSPKSKYVLKLKERRILSGSIFDFAFAAVGAGSSEALSREASRGAGIKFLPGQYMEWMIASGGGGAALNSKSGDGTGDPEIKDDTRGNRRYFTIASSPTENDIHLGVKFYDEPSSFKKRLKVMQPGSAIFAGQLAGDFTLPRSPKYKLVFIAGGIGITPFRSMIKYLSDIGEKRDIVLIYCVSAEDEAVYKEIFNEAQIKIGLKIHYVVTKNGNRVDEAFLRREVPDYEGRIFYISGPRSMVTSFMDVLRGMKIPLRRIKTDYFQGFA